MTFKTLMITAAASALLAGGAMAQDTDTTTTPDPAPETEVITPDAAASDVEVAPDAGQVVPAFNSIDEMTVGDIVGRTVYESTGASIGNIDYIIGQSGNAQAVVGIGGFLGLGKYSVALPLDDFTYDASQEMVKLDTTKEALKEQPEFDTSNVEGLPDETPLATLITSPASPEMPATNTDDSLDMPDGNTGDPSDIDMTEPGMPDANPDDSTETPTGSGY